VNSPIEHISIGIIRTPFLTPSDTPKQPIDGRGVKGRIELLPEYAGGLADLQGFSHIYLVYHMHLVDSYDLRLVPSVGRKQRGVFSTRAPRRPNPLGLSIVRLDSVVGSVLHIRDIDIVDKTPLLDIKPYVPSLDRQRGARLGWLEHVFADYSGGIPW